MSTFASDQYVSSDATCNMRLAIARDTLLSEQEEDRLALISSRRVRAVIVALCFAIGSAGLVTRTMAQNTQIDLNNADSMRQAIEQHAGKRVKLKLISGQDVEGVVAKIGSQAVSLTELTGMEFFDATVRLDQVAAVIVRRAAK
jgi:hypothetical protein